LAERLSAQDALAAGLVSHVLADDDYDAEAAVIIAGLASGPQVAYRRTKAAINAATLGSLPAAFAAEREGQIGLLGAPDFSEGAAAFQERREAVFGDR
jgi:enoyl-CoA hydratase